MAIDYTAPDDQAGIVQDKLLSMHVGKTADVITGAYNDGDDSFETLRQELVSNAVVDGETIKKYLKEAVSRVGVLT